jgi:hypothetical protein
MDTQEWFLAKATFVSSLQSHHPTSLPASMQLRGWKSKVAASKKGLFTSGADCFSREKFLHRELQKACVLHWVGV